MASGKQGTSQINSATANHRAKATRTTIFVLLVILILPLTWTQIVRGPAYAKEGINKRSAVSELHAPRGTIYDRKGRVLATSVSRYNVVANPVEVASYEHWVREKNAAGESELKLLGVGPVEAAKQLAPLLGKSEAELGGLLTQKPHTEQEGEADRQQEGKRQYAKQYSVLATNVTPEVMRQVRDLKIRGIDGIYRTERVYPRGNTAANVIGFMRSSDEDNTKLVGAAGIELLKEDLLKETVGEEIVEIGGNGIPIPGGNHSVTPAIKGSDIHLTLDADLTDFAQQWADKTQQRFSADWVSIVVQEVKTGKILALGDSGVVNPQNAAPGTPVVFGSRAVKDPFEPGSTGKLVTAAAALEQGKIEPTTPFLSTSKRTMPNGEVFSDSIAHPDYKLTAAGVIAQSSNTGTVQIGDTVTDQSRYDLMRAFGFGEKTGIALSSESAGILTPPDQWGKRARYETMFGQAYATTPLQITNMVATLGNGGVRNKVTLIDGYKTPDGTYHPTPVGQPQQVISSETAKKVVRMMEGVITAGGTTPNGGIPGYNVAAKTGTSQLLNKSNPGFVGSFAALVPAENPAVAIVVSVYRPKSGSIFGSVVATPAFKAVATRTMATLGVPPSTNGPQPYPLEAK